MASGIVDPNEEPVEEGYIKSRDGDRYLPPIQRIRMPQTRTQSARVRWLHALGYEIKDISAGTGIRYQQVRNMIVTKPKRASREDLPPLEIEYYDPVDDVEAIMDAELDRSLLEARRLRQSSAYKARTQKLGPEDEVDEVTEQEDLDPE